MSFPLDGIPLELVERHCAKVQRDCRSSNYLHRVPQDFYAFEVLYISDGKLFHSRGDHFHPILAQAYGKTRKAIENDTKVLPYSVEQLSIKMNKGELFQDAMCRILAIGFPTDIKKLFKKLSEELVIEGEEVHGKDPASANYSPLFFNLELRVKKIEDTCDSLQNCLNQVSDSLTKLMERVQSIDDSSKVIPSDLTAKLDRKRFDDLLALNFIKRALESDNARWMEEVTNYSSPYLDHMQLQKLKSNLTCMKTIQNTTCFFVNIFEIICDKHIAITCRFPIFEESKKRKISSNICRGAIPESELNKILDFLKIFDFVSEDSDELNIFRTCHGWNVVRNRYNRWGLNLRQLSKNSKRVLEVSEEPQDTYITYDIIFDEDENTNTYDPQELISESSVQPPKDPQEVNIDVLEPPNKVIRTYTRSAARNGANVGTLDDAKFPKLY